TGGFGYVGSRLVPHLLSLGHDVRVLDLMLYTEAGLEALKADAEWPEWEKRFNLVRGDLRDAGKVREALAGRDTVIHLAAISNDPTGDIDEVLTRQVNFDAVGMLLALAKEAGVKRFINASSSSVFGARTESEINERLEPAISTKIQAPVLIFHGLEDRALHANGLNQTWEWLASEMTLITLPGAGHFVQHDRAELVSSRLRSWLDAHH
ncbi:NAD-dependent epimerase/dehydratase family protein, partial [bacterium]|nr:NAD-dependent epimerase/dehydratase family protein [bacterium]